MLRHISHVLVVVRRRRRRTKRSSRDFVESRHGLLPNGTKTDVWQTLHHELASLEVQVLAGPQPPEPHTGAVSIDCRRDPRMLTYNVRYPRLTLLQPVRRPEAQGSLERRQCARNVALARTLGVLQSVVSSASTKSTVTEMTRSARITVRRPQVRAQSLADELSDNARAAGVRGRRA